MDAFAQIQSNQNIKTGVVIGKIFHNVYAQVYDARALKSGLFYPPLMVFRPRDCACTGTF